MEDPNAPSLAPQPQQSMSKIPLFLMYGFFLTVVVAGLSFYAGWQQTSGKKTMGPAVSQQVTPQPTLPRHTTESNNKMSILFSADSPYKDEDGFFVSDLSGRQFTLLPIQDSAISTEFAFSHDGKNFVYWNSFEDFLSIYNAFDMAKPYEVTLNDQDTRITDVVWSVDDQQLAFVSSKSLDRGISDGRNEFSIFTTDREGKNRKKVTSLTSRGYISILGFNEAAQEIYLLVVDTFDPPEGTQGLSGNVKDQAAIRHYSVLDAVSGSTKRSMANYNPAYRVEPSQHFTADLKKAYYVQFRREGSATHADIIAYDVTSDTEEKLFTIGPSFFGRSGVISTLLLSPTAKEAALSIYNSDKKEWKNYLFTFEQKKMTLFADDVSKPFVPALWSPDGAYLVGEPTGYDDTKYYLINRDTQAISLFAPNTLQYFVETEDGEESLDDIMVRGFLRTPVSSIKVPSPTEVFQ